MAKLPELRSEYIWVILMIGLVAPTVITPGFPFPESSVTQQIYDIIQNLPPGSVICMGGSGVFAFDIESSPGMIGCIKQAAQRGLKLITCPLGSETPQFHKFCIDAARVDQKYGGPWKYGVDYVLLPYLAGGEPTLVAYLNNIQSIASVDLSGTPLSQLPLMSQVKSYKDLAVFICPHWDFPTVIRVATGQYGMISISFAQSSAYATFAPYMQSYPGKVFMTNGYIGGAQYEKLTGTKGLGYKVVDSYTVVSALIILFIVLGNVTLFTKTREEKVEEKQ
jgi:hypothetical protein